MSSQLTCSQFSYVSPFAHFLASDSVSKTLSLAECTNEVMIVEFQRTGPVGPAGDEGRLCGDGLERSTGDKGPRGSGGLAGTPGTTDANLYVHTVLV